MKVMLILISLATAGLALQAQDLKETDVPAAVKQKFASMYPKSKVAKWTKEKDMYEVEFTDNKVEQSVMFDEAGKYIQKEVEISPNLLPQGVNDYVAKHLAKKRIEEAAMITNANGEVTYEAEVADADYLFDKDGNFIKTENKDEDSDNDHD